MRISIFFIFLAFLACFPFPNSALANPQTHALRPLLFANEEELDLYCLKSSYPQIADIRRDGAGNVWLVLADGAKAPYILKSGAVNRAGLNVDARESMAQVYPLEPARPDTPEGFAPGRKRPYALFEALYGDAAAKVGSGLRSEHLLGKALSLSSPVAAAFEKAIPRLEKLAADNPRLRAFLKPDGGFYWRKIAGENVLSAHSFGIAMDMGVDKAPYWRWSKRMPHPMQQSYPSEIVEIMEDAGFIWGGKWHEYDLMHFEYRPELICKARIKALGSHPKQK